MRRGVVADRAVGPAAAVGGDDLKAHMAVA